MKRLWATAYTEANFCNGHYQTDLFRAPDTAYLRPTANPFRRFNSSSEIIRLADSQGHQDGATMHGMQKLVGCMRRPMVNI